MICRSVSHGAFHTGQHADPISVWWSLVSAEENLTTGASRVSVS